MSIKGVIFDKDGTLLDFDGYWLPVARAAYQDVLQTVGRKDIPIEELFLATGIVNGEAEISGSLCCGTYGQLGGDIYSVLKHHNVNISLRETVDLTVKFFHDNMDKGVMNPTSPSLKKTLTSLKEKGLKLAVVTADDKFVTEKCLEGLGIKELFDDIFADDGVNPPKPDPYYANAFMQKYGLKNSETLMVGDTFTDLNFANNSKISFVGIAKNQRNRGLLEAKTTTVISDMQELLGVLGL
jgi:phosphoglycolate phosphatase-like HAD superfamily hydrolase